MTAQNDHLRKGKRATSDNQLEYEDKTTLGKGKQTTLDNQIGHEDEENDVYVTILPDKHVALVSRGLLISYFGYYFVEGQKTLSPKALREDLDGFRDQPGQNSRYDGIQEFVVIITHEHAIWSQLHYSTQVQHGSLPTTYLYSSVVQIAT